MASFDLQILISLRHYVSYTVTLSHDLWPFCNGSEEQAKD